MQVNGNTRQSQQVNGAQSAGVTAELLLHFFCLMQNSIIRGALCLAVKCLAILMWFMIIGKISG